MKATVRLTFILLLMQVYKVPATVFYVSARNQSPTSPYASWATAATNIQDAVDAAGTGDTIVVTNGVYASGGRIVPGDSKNSRVMVDKAVTVRSVNGPLSTIINGAGTNYGPLSARCAYLVDGAVLSGFTLAGGAADFGGGVYCVSTNASLTNCIMMGNMASWSGGGVAGGTLYNCMLSNNSARSGGGTSESILTGCRLTGNSGEGGGGANGGALYNCVLTGNWAGSGGGAYSAMLNNCTLTGNSASVGGGVCGGTLNNCIVYYNTAANSPNYCESFPCTFAYSCTTPLPPGPGNFETEPLLASATHLSAQSPCIGRGSTAYSTGVDMDGEPWQNPPCIGADQFVLGRNSGPLVAGIGATYAKVGAGFAVQFQALIDGRLSASIWDFGDGIVVSNHPFASHAWMLPGTYTVQLITYNDSYPNGTNTTMAVEVDPAQVYYVNGSNLTPTPPYTNWPTAATNIQDAIDAGTQIGRLVLVADGVYSSGVREVYGLGSSRVVVAEGVEVRSVHGPSVTVIEGVTVQNGNYGDGFRCAYVGTNSVLSGFTLTNGHASMYTTIYGRGGGAWCELSAVLTNCVLSGNFAGMGGGAYGGTLNNCTFLANSVFSGGGGAYSATLNDCLLAGNSGSGAASCTLNRCTLNNNSSSTGGGATDSILNDCVVTGNSAIGSRFGGGIGGGAYGGILNSCILFGNSANVGSGAVNATLNNCTISGNLGLGSGPAVSEATVNNCVVYFNSGINYTNCTFNYCCTIPLPASGTGNIDLDPQFVDGPGGNLRLRSNSPCINSGSNALVSDANDLDGRVRISGGTVDLGAYESSSSFGPPTIDLQPKSQTVYAGSDATFGVGVAGALPLSWQWFFQGTSIPAATNSILKLSAVTTNQGGGYFVVITNALGAVTSQVAVLTFQDTSPLITLQPRTQVTYAGYNVALTVRATGSLPLFWQWTFNGSALPRATNSTLTTTGATTNLAGDYFVVITNSIGSTTSQVAVLTVFPGPPPSITLQPLSQTVLAGSNVTIAVGADGFLPLSWQWFFNGKAIPGATNSTLTVASVSLSQAGAYSVVVSNIVGSATSDSAILTVLLSGTKYVWPFSPSPALPYTNWTTAAHTLQDAVDASVRGDEILATNGVYSTGGRAAVGGSTQINRVTVNKAVTIRSVNGPEVTVIQGYQVPGLTNGFGASRCAYLSDGALLSGFTLTGGATQDSNPITNDVYGAGAYCDSSNGVLTNCVVTGNSASGRGGGVEGGTLISCTLSNNSAGLGGGADESVLVRCAVISNSAARAGGAAACTLNNCILTGNWATGQGGAAFGGTLNNCVLTHNSAPRGGGVYSDSLGSAATLNNCTLTGNSATEGGGVYGGTLNNCIVYYNTAGNGSNYCASEFACTFSYSCATPLPPGPGNFEAEPLLASKSHLSTQSPCIGRGNPAYTSSEDIDGEPWQNPPCIGADQLIPGHATGALTVSIRPGYTKVGTGFAVPFEAVIEGRLTVSIWDFGDGVVVSNRPFASHTWATPGSYLVRLTGYNDGQPSGLSATVELQVATREIYYVDAANAAPTPPYTSRATAATNIQDAIDAGSQIGRLVMVTDGVYNDGSHAAFGLGTNRIVVTEGVEVRSVNGPAVTVIAGDPDWSLRCAYVGTNAVLSGFTLTNGGGADWCERSAVVTNCILTRSGGGGAYGGTLYNCTLSTNSGSGAYSAALNDCVLLGNSGGPGGGAASCTLNRCILTGNWARGVGGGGAYYSTLNDCTLTGNWVGEFAIAGGGVYGGILNNCVLISNFVSFKGDGSAAVNATLNNCTISGNSSYTAVQGGKLNNCIIYFNNGINYDGSSTLNYCCTAPMPTNGVGNITNAPVFIDYAGGNLRLRSTSPCINAGNNAFVSGSTDLDGNPRIVNGTVDIGAYEYQGAGSAISYAWLPQYGLPTDGSADFVDTDGDGMNNWQEWVCGTNPTNAVSCLRLLSAVPTGTNVTLTWQSVAGMSYFLERATNLGSTFTWVSSNIVGQAGTTSSADTNAIGAGPFFYRVGVNHP